MNEKYMKYFQKYRKTHNQGVFDAYTDEIRIARTVGLINWTSRCLWKRKNNR